MDEKAEYKETGNPRGTAQGVWDPAQLSIGWHLSVNSQVAMSVQKCIFSADLVVSHEMTE